MGTEEIGHERQFERQMYFETKKRIVDSYQSLPTQDNKYLILRQSGQILGQEVVSQNRTYQRPTGGIQDTVNTVQYRSSTGERANYGKNRLPYQDLNMEKITPPYRPKVVLQSYQQEGSYLL